MNWQRYIGIGYGLLFLLFCPKLLAQAPDRLSNAEEAELQSYLAQAKVQSEADSTRYYYQKALSRSRELSYQPAILEVLYQLVDFEREQEDLTTALRYQLEAITYIEKEEDIDALYDAYFKTATIYQQENLHTKALDYYRLAMPLNQNEAKRFQLHRLLGYTFFQLEEADSALYYYQYCLDIYKRKKNRPGMIQVYQDIVKLYSRDQEYSTALTYSNNILSLAEEEGDPAQIAVANNNIGVLYNKLGEFIEAIDYFEITEELCKSTSCEDRHILLSNLGIAYQNIDKPADAIQYLQKAKQSLKARQRRERVEIDLMISAIYLGIGDLYNALRYNEGAVEYASGHQLLEPLSEAYSQGAGIYQKLYDYEQALDYYKYHLELRDSFRLAERIRQQELLQQQFLLERTEKEIKLLLVNQEIKDLTISQLQLESDKLKLEAEGKEAELSLLRQEQEVEKANLRNKALEAERTEQELRITAQKLLAEQKDREISELQRLEKERELELVNNRLALAQKAAEEQDRLRQIERLEKEQAISDLELERQETFRSFVYWLGGLLALILILILSGLLYFRTASRKLAAQNKQIASQNVEIEKERNKAEELLLNILPDATATELKETGVATPREYEMVTVLFTDFSGFTQISSNMSPEELIKELNICFRAFDDIIVKYQLEKIKTIGDGYMCAGGIPTPNTSNPQDVVLAALAMHHFMEARYEEKKAQGLPYWRMRVGVHTGRVIAGVVGKNKFAYDIWGDTVNIASRMESNGVNGKICISDSTYQLVKEQFDCSYRGEFDLKHRGKAKMYFVKTEG
ncbi:MAG: adenylate/guanylate cyclase domain-containing protein [Bacteroidota bacterium]